MQILTPETLRAVLVPDHVDLKAGSTMRSKEGAFHNEKRATPPEIFYHLKTPSERASKYMRPKMNPKPQPHF